MSGFRNWGLFVVALLSGLWPTSARAEEPAITHGLKAEIYAGTNFERLVAERIDPNIEWFWDYGTPHDDVAVDHYSVRWNGWLKAPKAGRYKLIMVADDGARVWLDGQKVMEDWRPGADILEASVELTEEPQALRVEMFEGVGTGWACLMWQPTGVPKATPIPTEALYPTEELAKAKPAKGPPDKRGLVAEYFDRKFTRKLGTDRLLRTEALWGDRGSPGWGVPMQVGVRLSGVLVPPVTGQYKLIGWADDKMAVWIDGKPVLDANVDRRKQENAYVDLEANTPVPIRIEYVNGDHFGTFFLHWIPPKGEKELSIPPESLFQNKNAVPKK